MNENEDFDVIIIGAGIGGYSAALRATNYKKRVAIIDKNLLGGTCLNRGCIPTKALLSYARDYNKILSMYKKEIFASIPYINMKKIAEDIQKTIIDLRKGLSYTLQHSGVKIIYGNAEIINSNTVLVKGFDNNIQKIYSKSIIIATGSKPMIPKIDGLTDVSFNDTDSIFLNDNIVMKSVLIIGGGIIGIEFANAFSMLGIKVYIIEKAKRLLPDFPIEISDYIQKILRKKGIEIFTDSSVKSVSEEDEEIIAQIDIYGQMKNLLTDKILLATGRIANMEIASGNINIINDGKNICINNNYMTNIAGIYAIGDVVSNQQLAYIASKQGEDVVDYIVKGIECHKIENVPLCVFIDPEIAVIGKTEKDFKITKQKYIVGKSLLFSNGKAVLEHRPEGFIKVLMDAYDHRILGAQLVCENAVELAELIFQYIKSKQTAEQILECVFPHPTIVEDIRKAIVNGLKRNEGVEK